MKLLLASCFRDADCASEACYHEVNGLQLGKAYFGSKPNLECQCPTDSKENIPMDASMKFGHFPIRAVYFVNERPRRLFFISECNLVKEDDSSFYKTCFDQYNGVLQSYSECIYAP